MIKKLKRVLLDKQSTCWTYAKKRIGLKTECKLTKDLEKYFDLVPFEQQKLGKGSLVLWNHNRHDIIAPFEINEDGVIISHNVEIEVHVGVIEDEAGTLVSDVTRKILENHIPAIRVRNMSEVRPPDFIIYQRGSNGTI